jgi:hypothetical protein
VARAEDSSIFPSNKPIAATYAGSLLGFVPGRLLSKYSAALANREHLIGLAHLRFLGVVHVRLLYKLTIGVSVNDHGLDLQPLCQLLQLCLFEAGLA